MNKRYGLIFIFAILGVALWWFAKPVAENFTPATAARVSPAVAMAQSSSKTREVAVPVAPAVPASSSNPSTDPLELDRLQIKTSVSEMASLLEDNNKAGFMDYIDQSTMSLFLISNYLDNLDWGRESVDSTTTEAIIKRLKQDGPLDGEILSQLEMLKAMTPDLNEADGIAVYRLDPSLPWTIFFQKDKETGQWRPGIREAAY
jgi:hypothetical protein